MGNAVLSSLLQVRKPRPREVKSHSQKEAEKDSEIVFSPLKISETKVERRHGLGTREPKCYHRGGILDQLSP